MTDPELENELSRIYSHLSEVRSRLLAGRLDSYEEDRLLFVDEGLHLAQKAIQGACLYLGADSTPAPDDQECMNAISPVEGIQ
jgi:hypothetical protein